MNAGFISEKQLMEQRRVRQGDWEKIRQTNPSLGAPEETCDHDAMFDKLEEQKQKKELGFEETNRLKKMSSLNNDNMKEFLDVVDQKKLESQHLKGWEEKQNLKEFRNKIEKKNEVELGQRIQSEKQTVRLSSEKRYEHKLQQQLPSNPINEKLPDISNKVDELHKGVNFNSNMNLNECCTKKRKNCESDSDNDTCQFQSTGLTCIGILPGLGAFVDSSGDSDHSCSSDSESNENVKYDLVGRQIVFKSKEDTG